MANSEKVFQQRYLPLHIRKEVMPILFGPEAAGTNERLFAMLRRATMSRDEHAPLYATIDDMEDLEKRRDMQKLKRECEEERDAKGAEHPDAQRAYAGSAKLRSDLRMLLVLRDRKRYFDEADRRRALGQSTSDLSTPTAKLSIPQTRTGTADQVATYLGRFLRQRDLGGQRRPQFFSQLLLAYLGNRGTEVAAIMDSLDGTKGPQDTAEHAPERWTCLLCLASFAHRSGLTRHNQNAHFRNGAFDRPFPCPQCDRLGKEKQVVEGVEQWSNHVEQCHGIMYTPCLPSPSCQRKAGPGEPKPAKTRSAHCLLCEGMFYPGNSFSRHINKEHKSQAPFACLECSGQDGSKAVTTENWAAWMDHVAKVHGRDGQTGAELSGQTVPGKRKRGGCKDGDPETEKRPRLN
ncbi:hypothetical protein C8A05DRAFT_48495 [Staphylotrichum tortipilum]|uniref:C2H2-type domain-containing protein n=1 Tax=Staphylotrichum tortipilum TaxID=2831512 RepID=A0AAN6RLK4_9PEZI|nr:hypothetical protein C8A05DRAFT_48495 [Staphylotrichum longicolle]